MMQLEIELLVLNAQSGCKASLGKLYTHFRLPMKKYAYLRVNDAMVADDLVQNVWLKISKRVFILKDVSLFKSWLYKALRWEIVDWSRRAKREVLKEQFDENQADTDSEEHQFSLVNQLGKLTENVREVTILFYLNDLTVREISLIIDTPEGTVKSRLFNAREQLKQLLNESLQEN